MSPSAGGAGAEAVFRLWSGDLTKITKVKKIGKAKDEPGQMMLLFATVVPNGNGGFTVQPQKPLREIEARQAAQMLGVSMRTLRNIAEESEILKWRWSSERRGKRIYEWESVMAYREASKDPEFGVLAARATGGDGIGGGGKQRN